MQEYKGFSIDSESPTCWWAFKSIGRLFHLNIMGELKEIEDTTDTRPFYFISLDQVKATIDKIVEPVKASDKEVQLMEFVELRFGQVIEQLRSSISPSDMAIAVEYIKNRLMKGA